MLKNRRARRGVAISLVIVGGLLMALAPEIWQGLFVLHWASASNWRELLWSAKPSRRKHPALVWRME
ncbi:MAG: hypothetical protein HZY77_04405 [Thiobacillus sp.]|uniref:hypothetical protein n=1 Tax=Thiobacillus sp. TaxID=924 RepID=UPI00168C1C8F|nr:hypothetical protein [Thiobacillus sp.]QLQ01500.1 MAG: hypothetical protein HZY77_04405 [Thiobacillus sp.]